MVQGVSSNAGKSVLTKTFCRYFHNKNITTTTFKAFMYCEDLVYMDGMFTDIRMKASLIGCNQNFSFNNNPFQITFTEKKYKLYYKNQYIFNVNMLSRDSIDYKGLTPEQLLFLRDKIKMHLNRLKQENEVVIIEGSGNPTDVGKEDVGNNYISFEFNPDIYLVTNYMNGGASSSLLGSYLLFPKELKRNVKGYILNGVNQENQKYIEIDVNRIKEFSEISYIGSFMDQWNEIKHYDFEKQIVQLEKNLSKELKKQLMR